MKKHNPKNFIDSGYTLIEMAIVLMIVGLILGGGAALYEQYITQNKVETTLTNIDTASVKLNLFQQNKGRLPCPAPLNAARGSATYGAENTANCAAAIAAGAGTCTGGICVERTVRTDLTGTDALVLVGAVPFRTLQTPEETTFDGYQDRLVYAVTYSATNDTTFNTHKGAISIKDSTNRSLTLLDGSALYLTLSAGKDRVGAYSNLGTLVSGCAAGTQEAENCNVGFETGTTASPLAVYKSMLQSTGNNAQYFDDHISYYAKSSDPTWRRTTANIDDIQDLSPRFIGVGQTTAATQALEITSSGTVDSLRVYGSTGTDGQIKTAQVCDTLGNNCFEPKVIGGDNTIVGEGMKCPAGQYMSRIANGQAGCIPVLDMICPSSAPVLKGIDASGGKICGTVPVINCSATTFTACSSTANPITYNIPTGFTGNTWSASLPYAGGCRLTKMYCNGSAWVESGSTGYCSPPTATVQNVACGDVINPTYTWAWSGTAIKTTTYNSCGTGTTTYDLSACNCKVSNTSTTLSCPSPYSGTYPATRQSECYGQPTDGIAPEPSSVKVTYSAPTFVPTVSLYQPLILAATGSSASCQCASSSGWEFGYCPTGYTRQSPPNPLSFTSPTASWSGSYGTYRKRDVNTSTCATTYTPSSGYNSSNCTCDTTPTYSKAQTTTCVGCQVPDTAAHTISGVSLSHTAGDDVFKTVRDPSTCTASTTTIYNGTCKPLSFTWAIIGSNGTYTAATKPSNIAGTGCSCTEYTSGLAYKCRAAGDASSTMYDCKCQ